MVAWSFAFSVPPVSDLRTSRPRWVPFILWMERTAKPGRLEYAGMQGAKAPGTGGPEHGPETQTSSRSTASAEPGDQLRSAASQ